MEGSAATAPAAADAAGELQAPAEPTAPPADPTQVAPDLQTDPNSPEARLAAAEKRAQEAEARLAESQPPGPTDLLTALEGEDVGLDPADLAAFQQGTDPAEAQPTAPEVEQFENWIHEQIQEHITPLQEQRQIEQVQSWQKEHPDVQPGTPMFDEIVATMENLKAEFGDKAAMSIPLLNMAYSAVKAKQADAGATPAEQAGQNGASLETQPGQTQTGDPTLEEQYKDRVFGTAGGASRGSGFR